MRSFIYFRLPPLVDMRFLSLIVCLSAAAATTVLTRRASTPFGHEDETEFSDESSFLIEVWSELSAVDPEEGTPLTVVFDTGMDSGWVELGGIVPGNHEGFEEEPAYIEISRVQFLGIDFEENWLVDHDVPDTFGCGMGRIGASHSSALAQAVREFTISPNAATGGMDLTVGPANSAEGWVTAPIVWGTSGWAIKGYIRVGESLMSRRYFVKLNTGIEEVRLPEAAFERFLSNLDSLGGEVIAGLLGVWVEERVMEYISPITIVVKNTGFSVPLLCEMPHDGMCLLKIVPTEDRAVELGALFFKQTPVHFDAIRGTVSFASA